MIKWILAAAFCWTGSFSFALTTPDRPPSRLEWTRTLRTGTQGLPGQLIGFVQDELLIGGGRSADGPENRLLVLRRNANGYSVRKQERLPQALAYAGQVFTDQGVLLVGGETEKGLSASAWRLTWQSDRRSLVVTALPNLPQAVRNPSVTLSKNILYVAGGETSGGITTAVYQLDLGAKPLVWETLPPLPIALSEPVLFSQSNAKTTCLYVAGSPSGSGSAKETVFRFDISKKRWAPLRGTHTALTEPVAAGTVLHHTYLLLAEQSPPARLLVLNTVTEQMSVLDTVPGPFPVALSHPGDGRILLAETGADGLILVREGSLSSEQYFTLWDYTILVGYLILTLFVGLRFAGRQGSTADYFKGGGQVPTWAVGVSILGTNLSAITFMSVPAKTYATDWNYFFLMMSVVLVVPVVTRYFIPFYRRLNITSAYEYLDKRFSYPVRSIASFLYILLELGRLSIVLLLPSLALTVVTGMNVNLCIILIGVITLFYTFKGGIRAVIWTDVMQVFVLLGGAFFAMLYMILQVPAGVETAYRNLVDQEKFSLFNAHFDLSTPNFWVVLLGGWTLNFLSFSTDQTTVQRYLTTKDEESAKRSARIGAWIAVPAGFIFLSIGTLLYLFYYYHPQKVNLTLSSQDSIFPWYIVSELPIGIRGLLIAAVFAAAMSSLSSSLNSLSTALVTDFYKVAFREKSDKNYLITAKLVTLFVGALSTSVALWMANRGLVSLWDQFNTIVGLFTGGVGGVFLLGIFTKRANSAGAISGLTLSAVGQYLISTYTDLNFLLYAFTGLLLCFVSGLLISLLTPPSEKSTEGLTIY